MGLEEARLIFARYVVVRKLLSAAENPIEHQAIAKKTNGLFLKLSSGGFRIGVKAREISPSRHELSFSLIRGEERLETVKFVSPVAKDGLPGVLRELAEKLFLEYIWLMNRENYTNPDIDNRLKEIDAELDCIGFTLIIPEEETIEESEEEIPIALIKKTDFRTILCRRNFKKHAEPSNKSSAIRLLKRYINLVKQSYAGEIREEEKNAVAEVVDRIHRELDKLGWEVSPSFCQGRHVDINVVEVIFHFALLPKGGADKTPEALETLTLAFTPEQYSNFIKTIEAGVPKVPTGGNAVSEEKADKAFKETLRKMGLEID